MEYKSKTPYIDRAKQGVLSVQYRVFWSTKTGCFQTTDNEIVTEALRSDFLCVAKNKNRLPYFFVRQPVSLALFVLLILEDHVSVVHTFGNFARLSAICSSVGMRSDIEPSLNFSYAKRSK